MRIGELSRASGIPVPTIKYYVREGLLAPGERTSPNQVSYDDGHLRRLKLVRALIDVGGLSVADARAVLDRIAAPGLDALRALGKAQYALASANAGHDRPSHDEAAEEVEAIVLRQGWHVQTDSPAREGLAQVLATLRRLDHEELIGLVDRYARAAQDLAAADIDAVLQHPDADTRAETVIIGTVLGDAMLAALRRLAQESAATTRLAAGPSTRPDE